MAMPSGQIAAREVARQSAARIVASAHDGSALRCEDKAATAGSRRGGVEIGSGDTLYRRGDAPCKRVGTAPRERAGTAPRQGRRDSAAETRQAAGVSLEAAVTPLVRAREAFRADVPG